MTGIVMMFKTAIIVDRITHVIDAKIFDAEVFDFIESDTFVREFVFMYTL